MKIHEIAYHRNGIGGVGFYVVRFTADELPNAVAIVFPEHDRKGEFNARKTANACRVAVLEADMTATGNIAFAQGNSWRGDHYAHELCLAIAAKEEADNAAFGLEGKE